MTRCSPHPIISKSSFVWFCTPDSVDVPAQSSLASRDQTLSFWGPLPGTPPDFQTPGNHKTTAERKPDSIPYPHDIQKDRAVSPSMYVVDLLLNPPRTHPRLVVLGTHDTRFQSSRTENLHNQPMPSMRCTPISTQLLHHNLQTLHFYLTISRVHYVAAA